MSSNYADPHDRSSDAFLETPTTGRDTGTVRNGPPVRPTRKADRRIDKTKRALNDALFGLMIERGYERTSVADIVERANVGRSTFYAHYADKDDLLQEGLQGLKAHLLLASAAPRCDVEPGHAALAFVLPMLEHMVEVRHLIRALAGKDSGAPVQRHLHLMLSDLVRERLGESNTPLPGPPAFVAEFFVGAFLAVSFWWLDGHDDLPPSEIARMFRDLAMPALTRPG
jgi:AcrR family transcriptional regulator